MNEQMEQLERAERAKLLLVEWVDALKKYNLSARIEGTTLFSDYDPEQPWLTFNGPESDLPVRR